MDTISKVGAEGVETFFSWNEKVRASFKVCANRTNAFYHVINKNFFDHNQAPWQVREGATEHGDAGNRTTMTSLSKDFLKP